MGRHSNAMLAQMEAGLPPLDESAACARKLKEALFEGIKEADMTEIMSGLVAKAKKGDIAAARLLMDFVGKAAPAAQISVGLRANVAGQAPGGDGGPRLLAPAGGGLREVQVACARLLGKSGPTDVAALVVELDDYFEEEIEKALAEAPQYFEPLSDGKYRLTRSGREGLLPTKGK